MKNEKGRKIALWGAWLQLGLVFGLGGTVIGMINAFEKIAENEAGDPALLANDISFALITTAIGLIPALIGLVLLGIALFGKKYRGRWFFWFLIFYGVLWALNFPVGTIFGIALIVYLIWNKDEFLKRKSDPDGGINSESLRASP
ncbi:MAG: hypothetical protein GVY02_02235 [Bacteroidetes bacterium]|jgi:hypothetical protein|nr:hypothetical protein [Bacteroidota bacterium]